jgi:hypothetical protein
MDDAYPIAWIAAFLAASAHSALSLPSAQTPLLVRPIEALLPFSIHPSLVYPFLPLTISLSEASFHTTEFIPSAA